MLYGKLRNSLLEPMKQSISNCNHPRHALLIRPVKRCREIRILGLHIQRLKLYPQRTRSSLVFFKTNSCARRVRLQEKSDTRCGRDYFLEQFESFAT